MSSYQIQSEFQMNAQMSLYIPHVFPNFTSEYIAATFEFMEFGKVDHVDLVAKLDKQGRPYNAAYIHFAYWFAGPAAENFQARVIDPERDARIVHNDPWYWIVLENTAKKQVPGARKERININPELDEVSLISEDSEFDDEDNEDNEAELLRIKKENQLLRATIEMHIKHANACQMARFHFEMEVLNQRIAEQEKLIKNNTLLYSSNV